MHKTHVVVTLHKSFTLTTEQNLKGLNDSRRIDLTSKDVESVVHAIGSGKDSEEGQGKSLPTAHLTDLVKNFVVVHLAARRRCHKNTLVALDKTMTKVRLKCYLCCCERETASETRWDRALLCTQSAGEREYISIGGLNSNWFYAKIKF